MGQSYDANRWKRVDDWDARTLRLDRFAVEDPENGFSAFSGSADPSPGIGIKAGKGRINGRCGH
jgi:propanediol dehydratase large subunit